MTEILLIALSLALDAMAAAVSAGCANPRGGVRLALKLGLWFGGFQFVMPLLGFGLGQGLLGCARALGPWVGFGLLAFLGGKMLWDAAAGQAEELDGTLSTGKLCLLALATSLDALATGVSAACMALPLWLSCGVIGAVTFALSGLGALFGRALGAKFQRPAAGLGGITLIAIGAKFLLESL